MLHSKGEKITAKAHNGPIDIEGVTVAQVDDQVRLQKVETWFDPLEMFRQIAPNGIVNKEARKPLVGENKDKGEHRTAQIAEANTGSQIAEKSPSITQPKGEAEIASDGAETQIEKHKEVAMTEKDKLSAQFIADSAAPSYNPDPLAASTSTQSTDKKQLTPSSTRVATPESDSKPQIKNLANAEDSEVKEIPSNSLLNQVLKTLESVQSDLLQLSARVVDFEARINKLEGVPSNATGTAPTPGNAVAAAPESEETQRTHEEMSRISAGECPFLMNQE